MRMPVMGIETEYALTAIPRAPSPGGAPPAASDLISIADKELPCLREARGRGLFLENGSRLYIDAGSHPELATPECGHPSEVVRYIVAGEMILEELIGLVLRRRPDLADIVLTKCNVDYSGSHATWGCHESYAHGTDPRLLPCQLVPHLVTRTIFTGAGGFDARLSSPRFVLSPRAFHIGEVVSVDSTRNRGIFHSKDESLSGGRRHRLHVICGDGLSSHAATWLKVATTALILATVEAGDRPGDDVALDDPVAALRSVALDTACRKALRLEDGRASTAIEIQRHYLSRVRARLGDPELPPWAEEACAFWGSVLDGLERDVPAQRLLLDWRIKEAVFRRHVERRGLAWQRVSALRSRSVPDDVRRVQRELLELDLRYSRVGRAGLFARLDRDGVLAHRVDGVGDPAVAMREPPAAGRARVRGGCIRRVSGEKERYFCDWTGVWDERESRLLDLSDPLASAETWKQLSEGIDDPWLTEFPGLLHAILRRRDRDDSVPF